MGTNLVLHAGETFTRELVLQSETGVPSDLTGCSFYGEIRTFPGGPLEAVFTPSVSFPTAGIVRIQIDAATTATVKSSGVYDLWLIDFDGNHERLLSGKLVLRATASGYRRLLIIGDRTWDDLADDMVWDDIGDETWGDSPNPTVGTTWEEYGDTTWVDLGDLVWS